MTSYAYINARSILNMRVQKATCFVMILKIMSMLQTTPSASGGENLAGSDVNARPHAS